jgi:FkbM family methyltransferase
VSLVKFVQKHLRSFGYEVVPYPPSDWVRSRDSLQRLLTKLSIDCVFDVGANKGQFGDQLRDIGYRGTILSFEPVQAHFQVLSARAAARPPWKAFKYALGSQNHQAEINVNEDDVLSSFLSTTSGPTSTLPKNRVVARETVEVRRLDSIFQECMVGVTSSHLYLKLDTQGFDLEALRGADGVLEKFLAAQSEVSFIPIYQSMPTSLETIKEFQSRGFDVVDFMPVTRASDNLLMMEMDCMFARNPEIRREALI